MHIAKGIVLTALLLGLYALPAQADDEENTPIICNDPSCTFIPPDPAPDPKENNPQSCNDPSCVYAPENQVPEPGTIALFGAGMAAVALIRRRRSA